MYVVCSKNIVNQNRLVDRHHVGILIKAVITDAASGGLMLQPGL